MKTRRLYISILLGLLAATLFYRAEAQCNADFGLSYTVQPSTCQSNGTVTITLTGENIEDLFNMQYGLQAVGGGFTISPQASNVLTGVPPGTYNVTVRAFCQTDSGFDVVKTISNVVVTGNYQAPTASFAPGSSRKSYNDCATGKIAMEILQGSGNNKFTIISAPAGAPTGVIATTKSGNIYTFAGDTYPAGNYVVEVYDSCYTSSVAFTLDAISGYPTMSTTELVFRPVSSNPTCGLLNWSLGAVSNAYGDYYLYYSADMYEVSLSATSTPGTWQTWNASPLQFDLSPYTYADLYGSGNLKVFIRVKGCSNYQMTTANIRKPYYHGGQSYTRNCSDYTYSFYPWTDYDGMWCYPLSYELKRNSDNAIIWSATNQSTQSQSIPNLVYGVSYTLTTTDAQGTTLTQNISTAWITANTNTSNDRYRCDSYDYYYNIPFCYPATVTVDSAGTVIYSTTITSNTSNYVPNLTYGQTYRMIITRGGRTDTVNFSRTSNLPQSYTLILSDPSYCDVNRGHLRLSTNSSTPWLVGTTMTTSGPAGYTPQSYTFTSSTYYYSFPTATLPPGTYNVYINLGCRLDTVSLTIAGVYYGTVTDSVAEDCSGKRVWPQGRVMYNGNLANTYYRLISGPLGYDNTTVIGVGESFLLTQPGTYVLGMMATNSSVGCTLATDTIVYTYTPLQLNTAVTAAYICEGASVGNILIAAQHGVPPYTYQLWNSSATTKLTTDIVKNNTTTAHFTYGVKDSVYTIRVIDDCGNMFDQQVTMVDLTTASIAYAFNNNNQLCEGDPIRLMCVTLGETDYHWTGPNGWSVSNTQNPVIPNSTLAMSGWYYVDVLPEFCGSNKKDSVYITVNPRPGAVTVTHPTLHYCLNVNAPSFAAATGATPTGTNTLRWYYSDTTLISPLPTAIPTTVPGVSTYYVCQVTAVGCEGPLTPFTVTVEDVPCLADDVQTVQEYQSVEIDILANDGLPSSAFAAPFDLLTHIVQQPVSGALSVIGSGSGSKIIYRNDGAQKLTGNIDSFKYEFTVSAQTRQATVYIYVLQDINKASVCSGSNHTVSLVNKPAGVTFTWYQTQTTPTVLQTGATRTLSAVTGDSTYWIQPAIAGATAPYNLAGGFPRGEFTVWVANKSGLDKMRWTGWEDNNWHNPRNWTGVHTSGYEYPVSWEPVKCVDVVIPADAPHFPELMQAAATPSFQCRDIEMLDRAMLKNPHVLDYDNAKVTLLPGASERDRFVMWSAPLKSVYSGDYHFKTGGTPNWGDVYMNFFERANPAGGSKQGNQFTQTFGEPHVLLDLGTAFNVKVVSTTRSKDVPFTFPQSITTYTGADNVPHTVTRTNSTKFITHGVALAADSTFSLKVDNDVSGYSVIQVVNPYLAYLNISQFLASNNSNLQGGYLIWNGNVNNGLTAIIPSTNGNRYIYSAPTFGTPTSAELIPPLQSFFVQKRSPYNIINNVKMSPKWTTTSGGSSTSYVLRSAATTESGLLLVKASQGEKIGYALLNNEIGASAQYDDQGDVVAVFIDEIPLTLYSLTPEGQALFINSNSNYSGETALGLRVRDAGEVRLDFSGVETFGYNVYLADKERDLEIDLQKTPYYTFTVNKTGTELMEIDNRFFLRTGEKTGMEEIGSSGLLVSAGDGILEVRSTGGLIENIEIFNVIGSLVYRSHSASDYYRIPLGEWQIYIVKAQIGRNMEVKKVYVK